MNRYPTRWSRAFWKRIVPGAVITLGLGLPLHAADLEVLIAALSGQAGQPLYFREQRDLELLSQPLELHGRLIFTPPDRFEKIIESPYRESQLVTQGRVWLDREGQRTRSFSLSRAPELATLISALGLLLAGDAGGLQENFHVELSESDGQWRLELVPTDDRLARQVTRIRLQGVEGMLTDIQTILTGDESIRTELVPTPP